MAKGSSTGLYSLEGQMAFVTGASRGIGRGLCVGLAEAGADIVAVARTVADLKEVARKVQGEGRRCLPIPCDVTVKTQVEAAVQKAVDTFGRIDVLVNNAGGVHSYYPVEELPEEEWDRQVDLNLKAAFLCSQAVGKVMLQQGRGKIVNVGAPPGFVPMMPGIAAYSAAKAGLHNLTKQLALEWGDRGIWVNCLSPGGVATAASELLLQDMRRRGMTAQWPPSYEPGKAPAQILMGRPEDYVPIVLFLASAASDHLTGEVLGPGGVALKRSP